MKITELDLVDSYLTDEDIKRLLQNQKNICFLGPHELGVGLQEPGGPVVVNAPHHIHCSYENGVCVERIICEGCYAIITGQKLPCKDRGVPILPLVD